MSDIGTLVEHLFRHQAGQMVARLARVLGTRHLDLCEEVVQDALLKALRVWPFQGVPQDPGAWLVRVARNAALDRLRRDRSLAGKIAEIEAWSAGSTTPAPELEDGIADDQLRMIFTCCVPQLPPEARVALTLKALCGFGVPEIARAFLTQEATIAQRLLRARRKLAEEEIAVEVPPPQLLPARLDAVLEVLYLMFNEGYAAHAGEDLVRHDLVAEAVRLTRLLLHLPQTALPRVHALLALMLFQAARLPARTDAGGELLTLEQQDRALWDRRLIDAGFAHFRKSISGPEVSRYHVEASIASVHAAAPSFAATDWPTILERYDQLLGIAQGPVVRLNRAVAVAVVHGPEAGLRELDQLAGDASLRGYYLLPATRGELLFRTGDVQGAVQCWQEALRLGGSRPERDLLRARIQRATRGVP